MIGRLCGSRGMIVGLSASSGKRSLALSSCSRVWSMVKSMSVPQSNSSVRSETPSFETDSTRRRPGMRLTADSSGAVTSVSTSSGATPG